jgi:hypothetical protein
MRQKKLFCLGMVGAASLGFYLLLALRYPLGASLENPRASWASMVEPTGLNALGHIAIYLPWLAFAALTSNVSIDFLLNAATETSPILNDVLAWVIIWGPVLFAVTALILARRAGKRNSLVRALSTLSNQTP